MRRRILPALARIGLTDIDVASRTGGAAGVSPAGRLFTSYDDALRDSRASLVYVSTRNHDHVPWAMAALASGRHVVVDKPAGLSVADVERLAAEARRGGLLLAEANVWAWHPQFDVVRTLAAERGPVTRVSAVFAIPWLPRPNYRYDPACGGGMLWDLGPYAVSCGRVVFGEAPEAISAAAVAADGERVDTSFSVLMRYANGRMMAGHFGMPFAYSNRLDLFGPQLALSVERAFTTPADAPVRVVDWTAGAPAPIEVPAADAFARFLSAVLEAIRTTAHDRFLEILLADAQALDRLRRAALGEARG